MGEKIIVHWTKEEIQFLKDNIKTMTKEQIAKEIGRTRTAVNQKVSKLGLSVSGFDWTEERVKFILSNKGKITQDEMAAHLGTSRATVNRKFKELHMTTERRPWTQNEIDYLISKVGVHSINRMAKELGRTKIAVRGKLDLLGLGDTKFQSLLLTITEIQYAFNVHRTTVYKWLKKYNMPAKKKIVRHKKACYMIEPKDFWKWANKHKDIIDFRKYDEYALPDEPEWLSTAIKEAHQTIPLRNGVLWSNTERLTLISFLKDDLSYKKIASKMQRTERSIESQVGILRKSGML